MSPIRPGSRGTGSSGLSPAQSHSLLPTSTFSFSCRGQNRPVQWAWQVGQMCWAEQTRSWALSAPEESFKLPSLCWVSRRPTACLSSTNDRCLAPAPECPLLCMVSSPISHQSPVRLGLMSQSRRARIPSACPCSMFPCPTCWGQGLGPA